jgi:tetrahydromethanopterin S-methyltransferase subunit A
MSIKTRYQKLIDKIDALSVDDALKNSAKRVCEYLYKRQGFIDYPSQVIGLKNKIKIAFTSCDEYCYFYVYTKKIMVCNHANKDQKHTLLLKDLN